MVTRPVWISWQRGQHQLKMRVHLLARTHIPTHTPAHIHTYTPHTSITYIHIRKHTYTHTHTPHTYIPHSHSSTHMHPHIRIHTPPPCRRKVILTRCEALGIAEVLMGTFDFYHRGAGIYRGRDGALICTLPRSCWRMRSPDSDLLAVDTSERGDFVLYHIDAGAGSNVTPREVYRCPGQDVTFRLLVQSPYQEGCVPHTPHTDTHTSNTLLIYCAGLSSTSSLVAP